MTTPIVNLQSVRKRKREKGEREREKEKEKERPRERERGRERDKGRGRERKGEILQWDKKDGVDAGGEEESSLVQRFLIGRAIQSPSGDGVTSYPHTPSLHLPDLIDICSTDTYTVVEGSKREKKERKKKERREGRGGDGVSQSTSEAFLESICFLIEHKKWA